MKIAALRYFNVKRFAGRGIAIENIGDGVNVLCAPNEHGKSTSFEALHALFFQPHTGQPRDVKRLQPYAGGNPIVEADIVTPEGRFRIAKQYIGGKRASVTDLLTGRLVAQADEAEAFIGGLIRGGTAGPAGLLWVRQGVTGLEERSNKADEAERGVRESLLASVQGEVEAMTGGRRMAAILEACERELAVLVTPTLRPRAGGPYSAAVQRLEDLTGREAQLRAAVTELQTALEERARAEKRLAELTDPRDVAARADAVARADAAFAAAKQHAAALTAQEAEAALARKTLDDAQKALADHDDAVERAQTLASSVASASQDRDLALERRATAQVALDTAHRTVTGAEAREKDLRARLARAERAAQARAAVEALAALEVRQREAEVLRAAIEEGEALLATRALPSGSLQHLERLEVEIAGLRAAHEMGLPRLRMDYAPGVTPALTVDGEVLADGVERSIADVASLDLPGVGRLTIRANRPAGADDALAKAVARRDALLVSLGVADRAEALARQAAADEAAAALALQRQALSRRAPDGLARLRGDIARLQALLLPADGLDLSGETGDPAAIRADLDAAGQSIDVARRAVTQAQAHLQRAGDAWVAAEKALAGLQAQADALAARLGPAEGRSERRRILAETVDAARAAAGRAEERVAALRHGAPDLETLEAALARARSAQRAADEEAQKLNVTLAGLASLITARADEAVEETWRETRDALEAATQRVRAFETEVAVLDRLRRSLEMARTAARDLYLKPILTELKPLLGLLFDDVSIVFDDKTLLPQAISRNGQEEDIDRLSGGMREQLSILTRLAFARLLAKDGRAAPVILDDALVYSDDDRIERMFDALHRQSRTQQIIVFSCRQRAFRGLGGTVLEMLPWEPAGSAR